GQSPRQREGDGQVAQESRQRRPKASRAPGSSRNKARPRACVLRDGHAQRQPAHGTAARTAAVALAPLRVDAVALEATHFVLAEVERSAVRLESHTSILPVGARATPRSGGDPE